MTDEAADLLREVFARPDDDGVRAVLADVLQAAGDPRGELISLQLLASRGNREGDARIGDLLAAHARTWLGALYEAARACSFDRGFPDRLQLRAAWPVDDPRWQAAAADPALATIEDLLRGDGVRGNVYRRFLVTPAARKLRRIEVFDRDSLAGLAETTAAIEHVTCSGFVPDWFYADDDRRERLAAHRERRRAARAPEIDEDGDPVWDDDDEDPVELLTEIEPEDGDDADVYTERLWELCAGMRSITSLGLGEDLLEHAQQRAFFRRIRSLTIASTNLRRQLGRWDELRRRRLTLVPNHGLEPCDRRYPWDFKVELIPMEGHAIARISGEWLLVPLRMLEALPAEVTRVEVERSSDVIAGRIRDVVRSGVEVIEVPVRANNFAWEIR